MSYPNNATTLGCKKDNIKILAISGSAREASTNTALLRVMNSLAPAGVELLIFHRLNALPVFSPDSEGEATPAEVRELMEKVSAVDGIIVSSPEYVRAIPGGLKNAIDWMVSRFEVIDKPIALVHASHRGDDMLASLRLVLSTVSDNFLADLFLRFPLIGKSKEEIDAFLRKPEHESKISTFLGNFVTAVRQSGEYKPNE
ncbi:NADPH-dependent FMN reductase [Acidithiobacillus thiooxidans]|jgi:Predicted flavoprotein|uniref:NADPH-dependent FMN reductase n=1 Tax=Acidithiobacillus thiooxidans TaxID=930 RepID=UPI002858213C|nr:NADPH-dependent FMN reductase [Acidithiobacillus thiooxidans]MDR7926060.1 NADPH-dependent FMN reductase [Acidithiobacillus thiooxidans]